MNDPIFAVIGAGNSGQTTAAHLKSLNQNVRLYNRSIEKLQEIKQNNGIQVNNLITGRWMPDVITDDIKTAIEDADVIMITTPASSHMDLAKACAPYLKEDQIVILNPGRTFGALEFLNVARNNGLKLDITIAEAQTTLYTCRVLKNGEADLLALKNNVWIGSIPARNISNVIEKIKHIYPQFQPVRNTLITGLNNIGAILHPTPTLFNIGWIEKPDTFFKYYYEAISPNVASFLEKLDKERLAVAEKFKIEKLSILDWLKMSYSVDADNLYDAIQRNEKYKTIDAPTTIHHRYLYEDIPTGLVPISSLGDMLNVDTSNSKIIINLASSILNKDFYKVGRTLENLGLKDFDVDEIIHYIEHGRN